MSRLMRPLDIFLERLRSQAQVFESKYLSEKEVNLEQLPEEHLRKDFILSYPVQDQALGHNYGPNNELKRETNLERDSRFPADAERLAHVDEEEAFFRTYWKTLPDKTLARRTWPSELSYYCRVKRLEVEMMEQLEKRCSDLREGYRNQQQESGGEQ